MGNGIIRGTQYRLKLDEGSNRYYVPGIIPSEFYTKRSEMCDSIGEDGEAVVLNSVVPYEIINEGKSNPIVRFRREIVSCKSSKVIKETSEYTWENWTFKETLNKKEQGTP